MLFRSNLCGVSVIDSVDVLFNPPPAIALTSDTNAMCVPGIVQFYDSSVTGNINDPINTWYWSFGDGTTSSQQNPVHSYSQPGTYLVTLTVTTDGGCTSNNSSAPLVINAYPFPVAAFSVNSTELNLPYDMLICNNQSAGAVTYLWNFGDGGTSTAVSPQYLYTSVGIFPVQLIATSQYGCSDTASIDVTTNKIGRAHV